MMSAILRDDVLISSIAPTAVLDDLAALLRDSRAPCASCACVRRVVGVLLHGRRHLFERGRGLFEARRRSCALLEISSVAAESCLKPPPRTTRPRALLQRGAHGRDGAVERVAHLADFVLGLHGDRAREVAGGDQLGDFDRLPSGVAIMRAIQKPIAMPKPAPSSTSARS